MLYTGDTLVGQTTNSTEAIVTIGTKDFITLKGLVELNRDTPQDWIEEQNRNVGKSVVRVFEHRLANSGLFNEENGYQIPEIYIPYFNQLVACSTNRDAYLKGINLGTGMTEKIQDLLPFIGLLGVNEILPIENDLIATQRTLLRDENFISAEEI